MPWPTRRFSIGGFPPLPGAGAFSGTYQTALQQLIAYYSTMTIEQALTAIYTEMGNNGINPTIPDVVMMSKSNTGVVAYFNDVLVTPPAPNNTWPALMAALGNGAPPALQIADTGGGAYLATLV